MSHCYIGAKQQFANHKSGKFIIAAQFQYARRFSQGLAEVELRDEWGYIDKQGNFAIPPRYAEVQSFSEGLAAVQASTRFWGYVDIKGVEKISPKIHSRMGLF